MQELIEELKNLKEKIVRRATSDKDVDTVNKTIEYIRSKEIAQEAMATREQLRPDILDFGLEECMRGVNVTIHEATITINLQEK